MLKWDVGEHEEAILMVDALVEEFSINLDLASDSALKRQEKKFCEYQRANPKEKENIIPGLVDLLDWDRSPHARRLSCEVLLLCSELYREADKLNKSKNCVRMAKRILNSVNASVVEDLKYSCEYDRVELMRHIPMNPSAMLDTAIGWGFDEGRDSECEAAVLAEEAAIARREGDEIYAFETYHLALSHVGKHVPSLLALSELELERVC